MAERIVSHGYKSRNNSIARNLRNFVFATRALKSKGAEAEEQRRKSGNGRAADIYLRGGQVLTGNRKNPARGSREKKRERERERERSGEQKDGKNALGGSGSGKGLNDEACWRVSAATGHNSALRSERRRRSGRQSLSYSTRSHRTAEDREDRNERERERERERSCAALLPTVYTETGNYITPWKRLVVAGFAWSSRRL